MAKFIQIDEDGYFVLNDVRVEDAELGRELMQNLRLDSSFKWITATQSEPEVIVEPFDEPLVVRQIERLASGKWAALMPYGWQENFDPAKLTLDEWDRFHGHTERGLPFVFSRPAQAAFFDLCDEFDDESITLDGHRILIPPLLNEDERISEDKFWNEIYLTESDPGFDLHGPSPTLIDTLSQLKLAKSRILVLGAGPCHDAAYLAQQGHLVTAVDFSRDGLARAEKQYGAIENLDFVESDLFDMPEEMQGAFDLVFEHTCYCAIDPSRRSELVQVWRNALDEQGRLLGIFFAMERPAGPPYGATEWEIRERLKKGFDFLYWKRAQKTHAGKSSGRLGKELIVYAQKRAFGQQRSR